MLTGTNLRNASRHLLLSGIAPATTGVAVVFWGGNSTEPWRTVLLTIGSVLIGVGVFDVIFRLVAFQHFVDRITSSVLKALKLPIRTFYESRSHLDSVEHELSQVKELWAAWHVGPYRDFEAFFPQGRTGRILLTSPDSGALQELSKIRKRDVETMAGVINSITKHAMERNIEVRWFDGPVCNNLLIADPTRDGAWMRVELMVPKESPQRRPSFLVDKDNNRDLYDTFASSFEKMWEASRVPAVAALAEV